MDVDSLSPGPLRIRDYTADLSGVYLPFHDPLDGNTDQGSIEESIEQVRWTYHDLDGYLGFMGRTLDTEPDGDGHVGLSGSVDVVGEVRKVSALARIESEDGALIVRPTRVDSTEPLDSVAGLLVTQRFTLPVPLDSLLLGDGSTDVVVVPPGSVIRTSSSGAVVGS